LREGRGAPYEAKVRIEHHRGVDELDARAWDALAGDDDPFVEHAFLEALEASGSVGEGTGWAPRHVTAWEGGAMVGALPLYRKSHGYGEYIFDWGWASAAARAGLRYYPKLVSMVPFTPATGARFLVGASPRRELVARRLLDGALEAMEQERASSLHLLFLSDEERRWVEADGRLLPRLSLQFHFHNDGYASFDDFLARFRADMRKKLRKERRVAAEAGLTIRALTGDAIEPAHLEAMRRFYEDTSGRKGSYPYLTPRFFELAAERLRRRMVLVMAFDAEGRPVAGTLNFEKGAHLYGRYWGALEAHAMLHFELCYYRLIERAIERGVTRFEAGAQGEHKLRRGLLPARVHSAHHLAHPGLRDAVADFLAREAFAVEREIEELAEHGPFRRG
jgi:predicted N-acyltransferase